MVYGDLVVTKRTESVLPEYTIRIFDIKLVGWSMKQTLTVSCQASTTLYAYNVEYFGEMNDNAVHSTD